MAANTLSRWLRADEVAERFEYAPKRVRELARKGLLPCVRVGERGHYRFDRDAIESLLASASLGRTVDAAHDSEPCSASEARSGPATTSTEGER